MFKRKKSSINVTQQQPAPSPQQPTVTPLYERFATKAANAPTSFPSAFSASTNSVNYNGSGDGVSISRPMTLGKPAPGAPVVQGRTRLASLQAQKSTQELYQDTSARVLSPSSRREKALPPSQPRQQQGYGQTTSRTTFTQNGQSVPFHALDQLQPSSTSSNPYATYDREQPSPPPPPHSRETSSSSASAGASSVLPRKSSPELLRSRLASTSRVPDKRGSAYFRDDDPNPVHAQTDAVHAPTPAVPIPRPNPNPNAIPRKRYSLYDAPTPSSTTPIPSSTPTPTPHAQGQGQGQVRAPAMSFSTSSTSSLSRASVEKPLPPLIPDDDDGRAGNNNVPLGPPHAAYATPEPTRSPSPSSFNHNKHNNGDTNQNQNQNQNQSATDLDTNPAYNTKVKSKEKEKRDKRAYVNGRSEDAYHEPHSPLSPPTSPERHRQRPSPSPLRHQNAETESDIYTRSRTADDDVEVFKPPKMSLETHRRSPSPTVTGIGMARPQTPPTPTSPRVLRERAGAHARPVVSSLSTAPTTTFASASPPSSDPSVTSPTGSTPTPTSANANAGGSGSGSGPSSPERQQQQRPTLLSLASSQSSPTQRKKYSPLAAFRATSSASVPTTSSTTSTTTEGPNVNANVRVDTSPEGSTAQIGSTYPSKSTSPINNPNNAKRDGSGSAVSVSYDQIMSKSTTGTRSRREGSGGGSVDEKTGVSKAAVDASLRPAAIAIAPSNSSSSQSQSEGEVYGRRTPQPFAMELPEVETAPAPPPVPPSWGESPQEETSAPYSERDVPARVPVAAPQDAKIEEKRERKEREREKRRKEKEEAKKAKAMLVMSDEREEEATTVSSSSPSIPIASERARVQEHGTPVDEGAYQPAATNRTFGSVDSTTSTDTTATSATTNTTHTTTSSLFVSPSYANSRTDTEAETDKERDPEEEERPPIPSALKGKMPVRTDEAHMMAWSSGAAPATNTIQATKAMMANGPTKRTHRLLPQQPQPPQSTFVPPPPPPPLLPTPPLQQGETNSPRVRENMQILTPPTSSEGHPVSSSAIPTAIRGGDQQRRGSPRPLPQATAVRRVSHLEQNGFGNGSGQVNGFVHGQGAAQTPSRGLPVPGKPLIFGSSADVDEAPDVQASAAYQPNGVGSTRPQANAPLTPPSRATPPPPAHLHNSSNFTLDGSPRIQTSSLNSPSPHSRGTDSPVGRSSPQPQSPSHTRVRGVSGPRKLHKPVAMSPISPTGSMDVGPNPISVLTGTGKDAIVESPDAMKTEFGDVSQRQSSEVTRDAPADPQLGTARPRMARPTQPVAPPSPVSPEDAPHRTRKHGQHRVRPPPSVVDAISRVEHAHAHREDPVQPHPDTHPETAPAQENDAQDMEVDGDDTREPVYYPIERHIAEPALFGALLTYFTFRDWCVMTEVNDGLRRYIEHRRELRELVLERFLATVGYVRWSNGKNEPLLLTFRDLNSYMRGVSLPTHQYASAAQAWIESKQQPDGDKSASITKSLLASSCRAYTRVVLRLRAQAEAEAAVKAAERPHNTGPPPSASSANINTRPPTSYSPSSRPVSPSSSIGHGYQNSYLGHGSSAASHSRRSYTDLHAQLPTSTRQPYQFRSPLFRLGHAPLLRVFVPSVEGMWLSDNSVLDCEKELKRAGVLSQMRVGDVVWDTAVGDEGNIGRMVWDGNYLIDLDYSYSRTGDLPQYIHTLAFPPSYFHRVIRTSSNPICYIDISPWSEEIAANLQLLQDRLRTETPQGAHHTVVRWIHRSSFRIRSNPHRNSPITIPNSQNLTVDPAWYGTIVVETEGTNEGLADLQSRCKPAFPIRAGTDPKKVGSRVFRLLRERSRPGEIWICIVHDKERLM